MFGHQARRLLHRLDAALGAAFGIVLPLSSQQVALHRLRRFDKGEQASGSRREGAIGEQTAHQAELPKLLPGGAGCKQLLPQHLQQLLLQCIKLPWPEPAAVGQARRNASREHSEAIRRVLNAPAQTGARQPHG